MPTSLPRSTPADQQTDPAAILRFLDAMDAHPGVELHSFMLLRHGRVIAEGWWAPYSAGRPHLLYSLSKSFTATAAAFAQAEGLLGLDDPVVSHFPEFAAGITDRRSRAVRIRHIAAMASGHTRDMLGDAVRRDPAEPVRGFLLTPPDREPGTVFAYNQPCTYTLASIVQRNAGRPLTRYLRPRLLGPLGIGPVGWQQFPVGPPREQGYSGLFARTEDVAKLGLLYLRRGAWEGTQLIPESWVAEATSPQVGHVGPASSDWAQGSGFQFWMSRHGYRGDGAYGQFCVILPGHDAVVVTTAATAQMQAVLEGMWEHLLPGFGAVPPGATAAQDRLAARLAGLALPPCAAGPVPAGRDRWAGPSFTVPRVPGQPGRTSLTAVAVAPAGEGWQLRLIEPANSLTLPAGAGSWAVSAPADRNGEIIPVAASGGQAADGTLRAEIIFLETPHRMDIALTLDGRSARAAWRHPPLGRGRLHELHCPR